MIAAAGIDAALAAARPRAVGALLRSLRDLDAAEDAFQEACLRALRSWPESGPPRDPAAWLISVGRNFGIDQVRRSRKQEALPADEAISDLADADAALAEHFDSSRYRDDVLRLLFICCHPDLQPKEQVAVALRVVSGLSVKEIARAFLVGEAAMQQRLTRAKRRIAAAGIPFATPGAAQQAERLGTVAAMLYLLFNEGYAASGGEVHVRQPLCEEAIRLTRLLLELFPEEPEVLGLTALLLLQHARAGARLDAEGRIVLLDDQDRALWDRELIAEGLRLVERALALRRLGSYQLQAAIAAVHARAARAADTDWREIERLYRLLESAQPSPVITLNRAVAVAQVRGAEAALEVIAPLAEPLAGYLHFFGVRGALLARLGRTEEAGQDFDRAIALANTPAEAGHLRQQRDLLLRQGAAAAERSRGGVPDAVSKRGFLERPSDVAPAASGVSHASSPDGSRSTR